VDYPVLPNVLRLSEKIYSGGSPDGEAGFEALKKLGIKTLIMVDGAPPQVKLARKAGIRPVHLPFGYDGCPAPTANAIAKAVRDLPGPVYLQCHHGKHRSPVAAAMARVALDGISNEEAVKELERAGTGKNYVGLYADVRAYKPPTRDELDRLKVEFRESVPTPPLMKAMVDIEARYARLMKLQKNGWKPEPGLDPAHEALQLQELYTEWNRTAEAKARPAEFQQMMTDGERDGKALEAALRGGNHEEAGVHLGKVAKNCGGCHVKYRNVPQR
jgi:cytochrome c556